MGIPNGSMRSLGNNDEAVVFLDGMPVGVPAGRSTPNSIRCYLETLALENQRVLCSLLIDGCPTNLSLPLPRFGKYSRIDAETVALEESVLLLLKTAFQQAAHARDCVETALTLVLINEAAVARELWWNLARQLKEPVLTLSLLPNHLCGHTQGSASLQQLRKWQLEQVAAIIRDVDIACDTGDTINISNALENRVLPWLGKMAELIQLWHETMLAGSRLGIKYGAF